MPGDKARMGHEGKEHKEKSHLKIPEVHLSETQRNILLGLLPHIRKDAERLMQHFEDWKYNFPEDFERIELKHPKFAYAVSAIADTITMFNESNLTDAELLELVDRYNHYARLGNTLLAKLDREIREEELTAAEKAARGELEFDENQFSEKDKKQMRAFAEELFREIFPESHTDRLVKWASGQKLEGYQKILLGPANGIESAVMGFVEMFDIQTWRDLASSVDVMSGMKYKDFCDMLRTVKFAYENLSTADKIAPIISILSAIAFIWGGSTKLLQLMKSKGYGALAGKLVKIGVGARTLTYWPTRVGRMTPLAAMTGITLRYLPKTKS